MGGIAKFTQAERDDMWCYDLAINRQYYAQVRHSRQHRISYQKRYDKAHKEEIKVRQHEYYLKRKAATRLTSDNGISKNVLTTL